MSLDFKLRIVSPPFPKRPTFCSSEAPPIDNTTTKQQIKQDDNNKNNTLAYWTLAARIACMVAVIPLLLLPTSDNSAACFHLVTMPVTTYILQKYNHLRYAMGPQCILAFFCIFLTNLVAIALLWVPSSSSFMAFVLRINNNYTSTTDCDGPPTATSRLPLILLALALASATAQLLWVVEKRVVPRVMLCTATAMLIFALVLIAVLVPGPTMARRFFQSTTLPLLLMFMETSRLSKATTDQQNNNNNNNNKLESVL